MGKVLFGLSVSLDGFIADTHGDPGATHLSFRVVK